MKTTKDISELTGKIIGAAMNVHRTLGPGFLESVYQNALVLELQGANLTCETQTPLEVHYRERVVGNFLADLVVEGCVILELKAVMALNQAHEVQLVNYLTATGIENGLLLNFGAKSLGVKRKFRTYGSPNRINPVNLVNPVQKSSPHAFTILELLVAMAVFSLLIVMLMGMVDSASKLWRENENRVDSYREARAAISMMSRDLRNLLPSTNPGYFLINSDAFAKLTETAVQKDTNSAGAIFFLSVQPSVAQDTTANKSDICEVGYFLAYGTTALVPNGKKSMNLYRYFRSSDATFSNLQIGSSTLFDTGGITGDRIDLLALNVKSFRITPFQISANGNPVAYSPTGGALPDLIEISITALNKDTSKKLDSANDWTNGTGNLARVVEQVEQTFTTRIHIDKP